MRSRLRPSLARVFPVLLLAAPVGTPLCAVPAQAAPPQAAPQSSAQLSAQSSAQSSTQAAPPHAALTTSRILLVPAQGVGGAPTPATWLARYDSVLTGRLADGGVGEGWAYPRDTERYRRQNPSYLTNPRALGAQPLMGEKVKDGFVLPEPLGSRLRAYLALADARFAIVPVAAVVDSASAVRQARLRLAVVDGRLSKVLTVIDVSSAYQGAALAAADSLALVTSRLFVK